MSNEPVILVSYTGRVYPVRILASYTGSINPIKNYVVYEKSDSISTELVTDTARCMAGEVHAALDAERQVACETVSAISTKRDVTRTQAIAAGTSRLIRGGITAKYDTSRVVTGISKAVTLTLDTHRGIYAAPQLVADTERSLLSNLLVYTDTERSLQARTSTVVDTARTLTKDTYKAELVADTMYNRVESKEIKADTARLLYRTSGIIHDTVLAIGETITQVHDTKRKLFGNYLIQADTLRLLEFWISELQPQSISIELSKGQLTDRFEMITPVDLALESVISGRLLDWDYNFRAYESSSQGLMRTITGMYDIDQLLYTPFTYSRASANTLTAKDHAEKVAKMMGKRLAWYAEDFTPSSTFSGINNATLQNIIGGLFGWAGSVPQDWINVLLRGDSLKIVQRGHEPNTIDLTNTKHSRPSIDRKLMRSVWSGTGTHAARHITIEPLGFYGTIWYGKSMVTYVDGLVTQEVTTTAEGTFTSTYDYDYDDYLTKKVTVTPDAIITTTYDYAITLNDRYLASEKAVTKEKEGSETSETLTQHVYLGNGWYGTTVYVDGEFNNSSVSNGKPGGKASKYIVDQSNLNLGGKYPDTSGENYQAAALFDTSFPISDTATLKKLTKDIEWLNRKTEEKVSMDIWQYPHLIDFTDRIIFNGAIYFLESNQVTGTPRELKQSVTMIRWY